VSERRWIDARSVQASARERERCCVCQPACKQAGGHHGIHLERARERESERARELERESESESERERAREREGRGGRATMGSAGREQEREAYLTDLFVLCRVHRERERGEKEREEGRKREGGREKERGRDREGDIEEG
jgi:hypothetical protein